MISFHDSRLFNSNLVLASLYSSTLFKDSFPNYEAKWSQMKPIEAEQRRAGKTTKQPPTNNQEWERLNVRPTRAHVTAWSSACLISEATSLIWSSTTVLIDSIVSEHHDDSNGHDHR